MNSTYGPILVYYNFHAIPITREKIDVLLKFVVEKLATPYDRFYFCSDVRSTPRDLSDYLETLETVEVMHFSQSPLTGQIVESLCARMKHHAATIDNGPGLVVLISAAGDFGPTLTQLARSGWRSAIFHPPGSPANFLDYADERFELPVTRNANENHDQPSESTLVPLQLSGNDGGPAHAHQSLLTRQSAAFNSAARDNSGDKAVGNGVAVAAGTSSGIANGNNVEITAIAQDVRQGLTRVLSRLTGALGGASGGATPVVANASQVGNQLGTGSQLVSPTAELQSHGMLSMEAAASVSAAAASLITASPEHQQHLLAEFAASAGISPQSITNFVGTLDPHTLFLLQQQHQNETNGANGALTRIEDINSKRLYVNAMAGVNGLGVNAAGGDIYQQQAVNMYRNELFASSGRGGFPPSMLNTETPPIGSAHNGQQQLQVMASCAQTGDAPSSPGGMLFPYGNPQIQQSPSVGQAPSSAVVSSHSTPLTPIQQAHMIYQSRIAQISSLSLYPTAAGGGSASSDPQQQLALPTHAQIQHLPQQNHQLQHQALYPPQLQLQTQPNNNQHLKVSQSNAVMHGGQNQHLSRGGMNAFNSSGMNSAPGQLSNIIEKRNPFGSGSVNPFQSERVGGSGGGRHGKKQLMGVERGEKPNPFAQSSHSAGAAWGQSSDDIGLGPIGCPPSFHNAGNRHSRRSGQSSSSFGGNNNPFSVQAAEDTLAIMQPEEGNEGGSSWKMQPGGKRNPFASGNGLLSLKMAKDKQGGGKHSLGSKMEKFIKPAAQCPWEQCPQRSTGACPYWHPYKSCMFFPNCRSAANECGYAHPFCADPGVPCTCEPSERDPQLNHYVGNSNGIPEQNQGAKKPVTSPLQLPLNGNNEDNGDIAADDENESGDED